MVYVNSFNTVLVFFFGKYKKSAKKSFELKRAFTYTKPSASPFTCWIASKMGMNTSVS